MFLWDGFEVIRNFRMSSHFQQRSLSFSQCVFVCGVHDVHCNSFFSRCREIGRKVKCGIEKRDNLTAMVFRVRRLRLVRFLLPPKCALFRMLLRLFVVIDFLPEKLGDDGSQQHRRGEADGTRRLVSRVRNGKRAGGVGSGGRFDADIR